MGKELAMNRVKKPLLVAAFAVLWVRGAAAEDVLRSISWQDLAAANALTSGTVAEAPPGMSGPILRLVRQQTGPTTLPLLTVESPGIASTRWAIRGRVKYDDVAAGSYLEMWNHLPEGAFFTRSLAPSGPMGRLEGSSDWRAFTLPFVNREGGRPPERLVLNLVLAGPGTVEIGPLELVQFQNDEDPLADPTAWWSDRAAGMLGAIAGSMLGVLGACIGWLGSAGRAKGFVLGATRGMGALGAVALVLGLVALAGGQPYAVFYPLLLLGLIGSMLGLTLPRSLSRRYEQMELRRMRALDA
jgi:hypothetical protein